MKTPEQKAEEYVANAYIVFPQSAVKTAYIAGYNAANEWISVEDELPENETQIVMKNTEWVETMFYTSDDEESLKTEYTHWKQI